MLPTMPHNQTIDQIMAATTIGSLHIDNKHINDSLALNENATFRQPSNATTNTTDSHSWPNMLTPKVDDMMDVFRLTCSTAVMFGGLVPYIPQYIKIKKSGSCDGFSTYVCLTLLLANILRIAFWFGHQFELPLLIQSFVMIIGMMAMMDICIRVRNMSSGYVVSSIGVRPNTMRTRRRSLIVSSPRTPSPGDGSADLARVAASSAAPAEIPSSVLKSYHEQESNREESSSNVTYSAEVTQTKHQAVDKDSITSINSNDESPILNSIYDATSSREFSNDTYDSHITQAISNSGTSNDHSANNEETASVKSLNTHYFWDWDDHFSYVKFLVYFIAILAMITYLLLGSSMYIESLGFVAVFLESLLGVPQLIGNYNKKSTRGMSVEMVIMWLSGDVFKTLYFIFRKAPIQFLVCGSIQVTVDILIIVQVFWYQRQVSYCRLPKTT